jgi:hypothetical protein
MNMLEATLNIFCNSGIHPEYKGAATVKRNNNRILPGRAAAFYYLEELTHRTK